MAIVHSDYHLAIRNAVLNNYTVATTGSTSLSATALGFARASGSFITDGFEEGMEVVGTGFSSANNAAKVITQVTAQFLTISGGCAVQSSTAGRTLTVGMPSDRRWENRPLTPTQGKPFVEESYIPGPTSKYRLGSAAEIEIFPMYNLKFHVKENTGISGNGGYVDTLLALLSPGTTVTSGGVTLRVRSEPGPFVSQRMPSNVEGFNVISVTIPFRASVSNTVNAL